MAVPEPGRCSIAPVRRDFASDVRSAAGRSAGSCREARIDPLERDRDTSSAFRSAIPLVGRRPRGHQYLRVKDEILFDFSVVGRALVPGSGSRPVAIAGPTRRGDHVSRPEDEARKRPSRRRSGARSPVAGRAVDRTGLPGRRRLLVPEQRATRPEANADGKLPENPRRSNPGVSASPSAQRAADEAHRTDRETCDGVPSHSTRPLSPGACWSRQIPWKTVLQPKDEGVRYRARELGKRLHGDRTRWGNNRPTFTSAGPGRSSKPHYHCEMSV